MNGKKKEINKMPGYYGKPKKKKKKKKNK